MRGTFLNTATVAGGALVGLAIGRRVPPAYEAIVLGATGLVVIGMGLKMFLQARDVVVVAVAVAVGGILGVALGFDTGLHAFSEWARGLFGGEAGRFNEAVITTSVLYCVGPMTLLGCLQDGLEGKIELLAIKSTMDGITAVFFAAALGPGVLVTAAVILVFQGALTLMARRLRGLASDEALISEMTGAGGVMLMALGLGLLDLKKLPVANFLPAIAAAPACVWLQRRFKHVG
ncbi:MAG: DUF554 domain-containing protein [Fimbriimonas ginsengisoli]|uniref:DUF554 domain-containing protein n=1 Tax=Fimbriimonas ginsengisoli TaxID=1005039 RepID=A0A931PWH5_FIMGI|nr:DUF554 domain-containing protein [Fimbriimonas ginsengisoli]MBI3721826.1 DUF554 domain-containing protein [Fimbriimonas ginsengisoli]